ncbi:ABC transporter permease [candidate division KSB1 bacterium]
MLKNHIITALRNILKYKVFSLINITGLAFGMACCIFIMIWVLQELSFDRFHDNAPDLYRVVENQHYSDYIYKVAVTPYPLGPAIKEAYPEIIDATRYSGIGGTLVRYGENAFFEGGIRAVDPSFFTMFTFPFLSGNKETALQDPFSLVITKEMKEKYFGEDDPIGQVVSFNNTYDFTITGVIEDTPQNSSLRFTMAVPFDFIRTLGRYNDSFGSNSITTYVLLQEGLTAAEVDPKIAGFIKEHIPESVTDLLLQPFTRMHLYSSFYAASGPGAILGVYIFSAIALFVLLIACINFMNLSTARSSNRAREIGMRKVVGASKMHLIRQFLGESMVQSIIGLIIALIIVRLFLTTFNTLAGMEITLDFYGNRQLLIGLLSITVFTGLIAGSYPALFLSSFSPVNILKGKLTAGSRRSILRKIFVVSQFTLSIFLIIGIFVLYDQFDFMKNKDLGYDEEQLAYIVMRGDTRQHYQTLKTELLKNSYISDISAASNLPIQIGSNTSNIGWEGKPEDQTGLIGFTYADFDYIETMKLGMAEGRGFSSEYPSDTANAVLINEKVKRMMGVESALGESIFWGDTELTIVGVIKDFHFKSIEMEIEPLVMIMNFNRMNFMLIRVLPENVTETVEYIEETWNNVIPEYPFEYSFLDENIEANFRQSDRMLALLRYFTILAVVIACLGLFGLISYVSEQRRKEIGIRKVLGASEGNLTYLLCREFLLLVVLANIFAWPAAWYAMNLLLQDFAYRVSLGWGTFVFAGFLALLIALLTVSFQAIKAALANPVDSLRYE